MIRIVLFLLVLAGTSAGVAWLADRPGTVTVSWQGYEIETSVLVLASSILGAIAVALVLWSALRAVLRLPDVVLFGLRSRRRNRGYAALSRGIVAAGAGDPRAARKAADEAARLLGPEPLTLLLRAQAAQLAGDKAGAQAAFDAMAARPDTRLLGLRGLWMEAQRRNDIGAARTIAETAAEEAPGLLWATQAALETRAAAGDWRAALAALDRASRSGGERDANRRIRAVLLTADALARETGEPDAAREAAIEAVRLVPGLVPAATIAARLLARAGDLRKAGKILETAWRAGPHPELAETYVHLRSGDSARERLLRARALARLAPDHVESALVVMRAGLDASDFGAARGAAATAARGAAATVRDEPTQRTCLLMAELEAAETGNIGKAREWTTRAVRAKRDPAWVADGYVSDRWLPVSPVSGRIDAFEWREPVTEIGGPVLDHAVAAALTVVEAAAASRSQLEPAEAADGATPDRPAEPAAALPAPVASPSPSPAPPRPPAAVAVAPAAAEGSRGANFLRAVPVPDRPADTSYYMRTVTVPEPASAGTAAAESGPEAATPRPPDDPGPDPEAASDGAAGRKFRLMG